MKFLAGIFLAFSFLVASTSAHAQDLGRGNEYRLVGKGIQKKYEDRSIALSCDFDTCTVYQWLLFSDQNVTAIGHAFTYDPAKISASVVHGPGSSLKEHLQDLASSVMWSKRVLNRVGISFFGALIAFCLTPAGGAIMAAYMGGYLVIGVTKKIRYKSGKAYSLTNQDGFNWSDRPHRLSKYNFDTYEAAIRKAVGEPSQN